MKPTLIQVDPARLREAMDLPELVALVDDGWTIGSTVILEDPTKPQGSQLRVGFIMLPPSGAGAAPAALWLLAKLLTAHLCLTAVLIAVVVVTSLPW